MTSSPLSLLLLLLIALLTLRAKADEATPPRDPETSPHHSQTCEGDAIANEACEAEKYARVTAFDAKMFDELEEPRLIHEPWIQSLFLVESSAVEKFWDPASAFVTSSTSSMRVRNLTLTSRKKKSTSSESLPFLQDVVDFQDHFPLAAANRKDTQRYVGVEPPQDYFDLPVDDFVRSFSSPSPSYLFSSVLAASAVTGTKSDEADRRTFVRESLPMLKPEIAYALADNLAEVHTLDQSQRKMWMELKASSGSRNLTYRTRFELEDTVHLQLHGEAHVVLYAPGAWGQLLCYPRVHPAFGQSQVVMLSQQQEDHRFGAMPLPGRREFVLRPGDALAIPAFHFRRVTTLTRGEMHLVVRRQSASGVTLSEILSQAFPFADEMKTQHNNLELVDAAWETTRNVLQRLYDGKHHPTRALVNNVLNSQYLGILRYTGRPQCVTEMPKAVPSGTPLEAAVIRAIEESYARFQRITNRDVRDIVAGIYLQGTGVWIAGLKNLPEYFACLSETFYLTD